MRAIASLASLRCSLLMLQPAPVPRRGEPAVGSVHAGKVASVMTYGAFVDFGGGSSGLVHISQIDEDGQRVDAVEDRLAAGDRVFVRVTAVEGGRTSLSMRELCQRTGRPPPPKGEPPSAEQLERLDCVSLSYARSGGSGGQNVNKVETKVEVRLRVDDSPWRAGVRERLARRATGGGVVLVVSQAHRTQAANRKDALEKLASLVRESWEPPKERRQRSGISKKGKATRREDKRRRGEVKRSRSAARRGNFD